MDLKGTWGPSHGRGKVYPWPDEAGGLRVPVLVGEGCCLQALCVLQEAGLHGFLVGSYPKGLVLYCNVILQGWLTIIRQREGAASNRRVWTMEKGKNNKYLIYYCV